MPAAVLRPGATLVRMSLRTVLEVFGCKGL